MESNSWRMQSAPHYGRLERVLPRQLARKVLSSAKMDHLNQKAILMFPESPQMLELTVNLLLQTSMMPLKMENKRLRPTPALKLARMTARNAEMKITRPKNFGPEV